MSAHVSVVRRGISVTNNCRFVEANEFLELAVSTHLLRRDDNAGAGIRGLFNPETGERFLIEEEKLFSRPRCNPCD